MPVFRPPQWQQRLQRFMLDPVRSAVEIVVDDVVAALPVVGGTLTRLHDSWTGAQIRLVLDAAGVQSGDPDDNRRLRSDAMLDAANHPQVTFHGHVARPAFGAAFEISGILTFRHTQFPLLLEAQDLGEREGSHRLGAQATLRPPPCHTGRGPRPGWNLVAPAAVEIVVHAEWFTVNDPMPAA